MLRVMTLFLKKLHLSIKKNNCQKKSMYGSYTREYCLLHIQIIILFITEIFERGFLVDAVFEEWTLSEDDRRIGYVHLSFAISEIKRCIYMATLNVMQWILYKSS